MIWASPRPLSRRCSGLDWLGAGLVLSNRRGPGHHHHQRHDHLPANRRPHSRRAHRRKQAKHRLPDPVHSSRHHPRLARSAAHHRPTNARCRNPNDDRNQHSPIRNNRIQPTTRTYEYVNCITGERLPTHVLASGTRSAVSLRRYTASLPPTRCAAHREPFSCVEVDVRRGVVRDVLGINPSKKGTVPFFV